MATPETRTLGIVCDNYKLSKYEERLQKEGWSYEVNKYGNLKAIKITVVVNSLKELQNEAEKVAKICKELELYFKTKN